VFQKELGKRTVSVAALKRSARELLDSSHDDPTLQKMAVAIISVLVAKVGLVGTGL
jgi:hypothetical protein